MLTEKQHILRLFAAVFSFTLLFCLLPAKAQTLQQDDIRIAFLKDTVIQNGNSFSFNRVSITNTSSRKQAIGLQLTVPENWQSLFDNRQLFQLEPNETLELPIRVAAASNSFSIDYPIILAIKDGGINTKSTYTYFAKVKVNSKWRGMLINPEIKLNRIARETYFQVLISNKGNVTEEFTINFNTPLDLSLPKNNTILNVRANSDTIIQVGIISELRHLSAFKPQNIAVEITAKNKSRQTLIQKVFSSSTIFLENASRWYKVPLWVEFVSQNFSSNQDKLYYINSAGNIALENKRAVSFNFRSNDYYSTTTGNSRNANITYKTQKWNVSLGDQTEFNSFLFNGLGANVSYKADNGYSINVLGIRSRLGAANQFSLQQEIPAGRNKISSKTVLNFDQANKVNSYLTIAGYDLILGKSNNLAVEGGLSSETTTLKSSKINTGGQTMGLRYDYTTSRFIARSISNLSSKNFPGLERGVTRSSNEMRFILKNYFAGAVADYNSRSVGYFNSDELVYLFGGRSSEYGLRGGYNKGRNYLYLTGSVVNQLQDSSTNTPFRSHKINANTGLAFAKAAFFSLSANLAKSRLVDNSDSKSIYSLNASGSLQTKGAGLSFRVDKGPFYYSELTSYLNDGSKTNRFQLSPYAEKDFFKSQLNTRMELNYAKDVGNNIATYIARLDVNLDLNNQGLSLRFFGNRNFNSTYNLNSINLSVRKNFNLPLLGLRQYENMKVVLFKDRNNNYLFDLNDEPIPEANLRIKNQYFVTNKFGEAFYKNISEGNYTLDLSQVYTKGWIPKNGIQQLLVFDKSQDWYIPFQESKYITGRLNVIKDPFSNLKFSAANIRITAINSRGESLSTLTDNDGAFFLNVPADTYLIKINSNVFNEDFRVLEETFNIDLREKDNEIIVFEIRERKRKMNIRKQ